MTKEEIIRQIFESHKQLAADLVALDEARFNYAPAGKWNAGQQLLHVYKSLSPLTRALALPKLLPALVVGKAKQASRSDEAVVALYLDALAKGGVAPPAFVPAPVLFADRQALEGKLQANLAQLEKNLAHYTEQDLDTYRLPHPLIGKLSVREMLYFTLYHCRHHHQVALENLQSFKALS